MKKFGWKVSHFTLRMLATVTSRASPPMSKERRSPTCTPRDSWNSVARDTSGLPRSAAEFQESLDRKSTRLNSSHDQISYAVFCLKKKKKQTSKTTKITAI